MFSLINLFRLLFLFLFFLALYPFVKNKSVYWFLKFAGPSFVKLGQALSVRSDLIGDNLAKILANFQDRFSPFSIRKVKKILHKEFGENLNQIFAEFNFSETASASIAQVHKAKLLNGKFVAVKLLRPNINFIMSRDINTIRFLSIIIRPFSKFLAKTLADILQLLQEISKSELDLLQEASNASKLRDDLKGLEGFYVPEIYWKHSSSKILVMEWIDGIPFSNKEAILSCPVDHKKVAQNLVISYFNQVYVHGFFHADMHPGNLFLLNSGTIAVVDFGIMGRIDKKMRLAVAEILIGFLNRDYDKVAKLHIEAGLVPSDTDLQGLALSCRKIGETIVDTQVKDISIAGLLTNVIKMTRDYKMDTKPELLLLQKTLLLVEGVGVALDSNLNIWDLARPWVKEWAKNHIGFDAKLRDAFLDLFEITKNVVRNSPTLFSKIL